MAVTYAINGSTASLAPTSVQWQPIPLGIDHNGAQILSANWNVVMSFPSGSISFAQQWLSQASGGTSVNLTILDRWQMGTTILSNVHMDITGPPTIQDVTVSQFTITVRGATASALEISPGA